MKLTKKSLIMLVWTLICSLFNENSAQCDINSNKYMYFHSIFANKRWTSANIAVSLPQSVCSNTPTRVLFIGDTLKTIAVLVNPSNTISISKITIEKESDCICCPKIITMSEPVETELSVDSDSPISAFAFDDTLLLAFRVSPLEIKTFKLTIDGIIKSMDSITINQKNADQAITTINYHFKSGIWIGGSGGLIRYIPFTNSHWGSPATFDLSQPETLVVLDSIFAATNRGNTYLNINGKFQIEKTFPFTIHGGTNNWLSSDQKIVYKIKSQWQYLDIATEPVHAHVIYSDSSAILEWLDKDWNYGSAKVTAQPTSMRIIKPDTINKYINKDTLKYNYRGKQPLNFTVLLTNSANYMQLPDLKPIRYYSNTSLYKITGYQFYGKSQDPSCVTGKANLVSDTIRYTITPDSVYWESEFLLGTIDFTCGSCKQVRRHIKQGNSIKQYEGICLSTGTDSLVIKTGEPQSTKIANIGKKETLPCIRITNTKLLFNPGKSLYGGTIKIYSIAGKCIVTTPFIKDQNVIEIPLKYASQSVIIRVVFDNGLRMERIVPGYGF